MHKYIYDDTPIVAGDIVEYTKPGAKGSGGFICGLLYHVKARKDSLVLITLDSKGSSSNGHGENFFRKVKVLKNILPLKGDAIFFIGRTIDANGDRVEYGDVRTAQRSSSQFMYWSTKAQMNNSPELWITLQTVNFSNVDRDPKIW